MTLLACTTITGGWPRRPSAGVPSSDPGLVAIKLGDVCLLLSPYRSQPNPAAFYVYVFVSRLQRAGWLWTAVLSTPQGQKVSDIYRELVRP